MTWGFFWLFLFGPCWKLVWPACSFLCQTSLCWSNHSKSKTSEATLAPSRTSAPTPFCCPSHVSSLDWAVCCHVARREHSVCCVSYLPSPVLWCCSQDWLRVWPRSPALFGGHTVTASGPATHSVSQVPPNSCRVPCCVSPATSTSSSPDHPRCLAAKCSSSSCLLPGICLHSWNVHHLYLLLMFTQYDVLCSSDSDLSSRLWQCLSDIIKIRVYTGLFWKWG